MFSVKSNRQRLCSKEMRISIFYMLLDRKMKKYTEPLIEAKNPCCMHLFLHEHTQATILSNTILRFIFILLIIKVQVACRIVTKNILGTSKMTADMERKTFSSICYTDFKSNPIVRSLKNKASLFNQPIDNFIRNKFNKSN